MRPSITGGAEVNNEGWAQAGIAFDQAKRENDGVDAWGDGWREREGV